MKLRPEGGLPTSCSKGVFGAEPQSLRQVKTGKREKKKIIEVHLKFYTLVFIYLVFLEGAARRAEGLCKSPIIKQKPEILCDHTDGLNIIDHWCLGSPIMRWDSSVLC